MDISVFIPEPDLRRAEAYPPLTLLRVVKAGYFERTAGHYIKRDGIDEAIMIYCIAGQGSLETGGSTWHARSGDLLIIPAHVPHAYGADPANPWSILWLHIQGTSAGDLIRDSGFDATRPLWHLGRLLEGTVTQPAMFMRRIIDLLAGGCDLTRFMRASASLMELFAFLIDQRRSDLAAVPEKLDLDIVTRYMQEHISRSLNLTELAALCRLSKFHFCRLFKAQTGSALIEYHNRLRLKAACDLLDTTSLSITEISRLLGYSSPYHFSSAFSKLFGQPPSLFRRIHGTRMQKTGRLAIHEPG